MRAAVLIASIAATTFLHCPAAKQGTDAPKAYIEAPAVCEALQRNHCAIGTDPGCLDTMRKAVEENHTTAAAMACVVTAKTPTEVVACDRQFFSCPQ